MAQRLWNISEFSALLRQRATAGQQPTIDLGQGSPTGPTPRVVQEALRVAANAPGYPKSVGSQPLREAYAAWAQRRLSVEIQPDAVLATIGSKELIADLPRLLRLSNTSLVGIPALAYPTYEVGALRVGAQVIRSDSLLAFGPSRPNLLWLNTPSNPTGKTLPVQHLRKVVQWARDSGCVVASDECYLELAEPDSPAPSILSPEVNDGDLTGLLAVHSLSKRSAMAGYREGMVSGDPGLIADLASQRRNAGLIVPEPIQAAATAAWNDDDHVRLAAQQYQQRRVDLAAALTEAAFVVQSPSEGLFLWVRADPANPHMNPDRTDAGAPGSDLPPDMQLVEHFLALGILVAPGSFYGPSGHEHVRISLTGSPAEQATAVQRIVAAGPVNRAAGVSDSS
ncbi:MAG: aminotransferase class I/II-fold pyridoxal phosphate-dependent enzyme [Actinomycetia bacterium]|nr:aminotransferase class I/II-fold pyridoxal phosphate-dependent enzyme [Actinomycetes bacterium]